MALVKCKQCGNGNAPNARTCPKCGAPLEPQNGAQGIALLVVLLFCVSPGVVTVYCVQDLFALKLVLWQRWILCLLACFGLVSGLASARKLKISTPEALLGPYGILSVGVSAVALLAHFGLHQQWPRKAWADLFPEFIDPPAHNYRVSIHLPKGATVDTMVSTSERSIEERAQGIRLDMLNDIHQKNACPMYLSEVRPGSICDSDAVTYTYERTPE